MRATHHHDVAPVVHVGDLAQALHLQELRDVVHHREQNDGDDVEKTEENLKESIRLVFVVFSY